MDGNTAVQCAKKGTCILRDTYRWRLQVNDNNTVNGQGRQSLAHEISQPLNSHIAASFEIPGRRDSVSMLTEGIDAPSTSFCKWVLLRARVEAERVPETAVQKSVERRCC